MALSCVISEIKRDIGRKSRFFHTPLHSTPPLRGSPSEYRHKVWNAKTRMVRLPTADEEKKVWGYGYSLWQNPRWWRTERRTDGQTDTAWRHRPRLCIASRGKNQSVSHCSVTYSVTVYIQGAGLLVVWRTVLQNFYRAMLCIARSPKLCCRKLSVCPSYPGIASKRLNILNFSTIG